MQASAVFAQYEPVGAAPGVNDEPPPPSPAPAPPASTTPAPAPVAPAEPAYAPPSDSSTTPPPPPPPERSGDYGGRAPREESRYEPQYESDEPDAESDPDDYGGDSEPLEFSVRLDPFNWLLQGRLGIELEIGVWKWLSIEVIPVLVANDEPPAINFAGFDDELSQHSNGVGPFSGASLGAGLWLSGEPFTGYVLRMYFTNYGYTYEARDSAGVFDKVSFTQRRFVGFFGSHSRFGVFTIAGGFGLGYELNSQERCGLTVVTPSSGGADVIDGRRNDCDGEQRIAIKRDLSQEADLNGPLHPMYLEARFSLGFVF